MKKNRCPIIGKEEITNPKWEKGSMEQYRDSYRMPEMATKIVIVFCALVFAGLFFIISFSVIYLILNLFKI